MISWAEIIAQLAINDELVIRGVELGFLDILANEYADLTALFLGSFEFSARMTFRLLFAYHAILNIHARLVHRHRP